MPRTRSRCWWRPPLAALLVAAAACGGDDGDDGAGGGDAGAGGTDRATTEAQAPVDLQPVDMRFEAPDDAAAGYTHVLVLEVRNNEAGTATGFDVTCTYDNAGTSGGIVAVQSGVLGGNDSFTYRQLVSVQGPIPSDAFVECVADPGGEVAEAREDNNSLAYRVPVP